MRNICIAIFQRLGYFWPKLHVFLCVVVPKILLRPVKVFQLPMLNFVTLAFFGRDIA